MKFDISDILYENKPTENQINAMDTIVYYLPELEDERDECDTKKKAHEFISKYMEASYRARKRYLNRLG